MGVLRGDDAVVQDEHAVGDVQQRGAAGDHQGGTAPAQLGDAPRDELLGHGVDGRGGVAQHQDVGVGGQGAGQGEPLALAPGEVGAAVADGVVEPFPVQGDDVGQHRGLDGFGNRPAGARRVDVGAQGAREDLAVVRIDQQTFTDRLHRQVREVPSAQAHRPPVRVGRDVQGEDRGEVGRRAGLVRGDGHELAGRHLEPHLAQRPVADAVDLQVRAPGRPGAARCRHRRGGEHEGHPLGRGARHHHVLRHLREQLQRLHDELREAHGRDEFTDGDPPLEGQPPRRQGHGGGEHRVEGECGARVDAVDAGDGDRLPPGVGADPAVGPERRVVAAEAVQRAQAGDEVGDLGARPRHPGLLLPCAGADAPGHHAQHGQDRDGSHDDEQAEPGVGQAQGDSRDQHRHQRADQQRHHLDDVGGLVGVLGGDGQHLAGLEVDVPGDRLEARARDPDPPAVRLGRVGLLQDPHPEPPGQRHGRDDDGQRRDGEAERLEAPVAHGVFDDQAERDGKGGLAGLVEAHEEGAPRHRADVAPQGGTEDAGPRAGPLGVRSGHRGGGQSLPGCAG